MKRKNNSKAQIAGQVFVFIMAAALAVLIIIYGYKAITSFTSRANEISIVNFKTQLQSEIRTISSDFGSVKRLDLTLPGNFDGLCFIDLSVSSTYAKNTCLCKQDTQCPGQRDYNPVVCDAWTTAGYTENVFLVSSSSTDSMKVTSLDLGLDGYKCFHGSKIILRLEGEGDKTKISEWQ